MSISENSPSGVSSDRPLKPAALRGLRLKCPNCGEGHVMRAYLKVADTCDKCGEELYHQRADDGPAYLTILVTGHIVAPLILYVVLHYHPRPIYMAIAFGLSFTAVALFLLPRFKGMIVGIQWAKRMYGFRDTGA